VQAGHLFLVMRHADTEIGPLAHQAQAGLADRLEADQDRHAAAPLERRQHLIIIGDIQRGLDGVGAAEPTLHQPLEEGQRPFAVGIHILVCEENGAFAPGPCLPRRSCGFQLGPHLLRGTGAITPPHQLPEGAELTAIATTPRRRQQLQEVAMLIEVPAGQAQVPQSSGKSVAWTPPMTTGTPRRR